MPCSECGFWGRGCPHLHSFPMTDNYAGEDTCAPRNRKHKAPLRGGRLIYIAGCTQPYHTPNCKQTGAGAEIVAPVGANFPVSESTR